MFSKLKMVGLTMVFGLFGCQQNTLIEKAEIPPASTPKPVEIGKEIPDSRVATFVRPKPKPNEIPTCMAAALSGRLKVQGSCLVIANGNDYTQPIFEKSSINWDEASKTLTFEGKKYKEGDEIRVGGGGLPTDETYPKKMSMGIPDCPNSHLFLVC